MRRRFIGLAVCLALAGCGTRKCKTGTLLLDVQLDGAAASATQLAVSVVAGGKTMSATLAHAGGSGTIEVDFGGGYPSGAMSTVTVTALSAGGALGSGSTTIVLTDKCEAGSITVVPGAVTRGDMASGGGGDLATGPDLAAAPDLAMPDLMPPPDMTDCTVAGGATDVYVDPSRGSDDAMHGGKPGSCAYKTITYAIANGGSAVKIDLAMATYTGPAETFPLTLTGTQRIDCDPGATGNKATLDGTGQTPDSNQAGVLFTGSANGVYNCIITGMSHGGNSCVHVTSAGSGAGGHVVKGCEIHDCNPGVGNIGSAISVINGGTNVNVIGCNIHNVNYGYNNFTATGSVKNTQFSTIYSGGYGVSCPSTTGAGFTGCGVTYPGVAAANECNGCTNCAFTTIPVGGCN